MKTSLRQLILTGVLLELMIFMLSYFFAENFNEAIRLSARFTGRLSAVLFLMVFFLYANLKGGKVERRSPFFYNLILFAILHIIHFGFLAANVLMNSIELIPVKLVGGALAYGMIVTAPLVFDRLKRGLQLVYFYYVSLVMIITYVARANGDFQGAEPSLIHFIFIGIYILACLGFGVLIRKNKKLIPF
ncbi:MAG: hypothetical protein P8P48_07570 [Saprospiraceae bacterium]|nr:hypothetical protein [Saprospiraceae bacterium]